MGTLNAIAFSLLGSLMGFLPALWPAYFAVTGISGADNSELWLEFMGIVQGSLGTFYIIRNEILPMLLRITAWTFPKPADQPQPGVILRPVSVGYLSGQGSSDRSIAA